MFAIVLFVLYVLLIVFFYPSSRRINPVSQPEISNFSEETLKIYDPWLDAKLAVQNSVFNHCPSPQKTVFLLPPAKDASVIELKKINFKQMKSCCSLLREYGFIEKHIKFSGKGVIREKLIQHLKTAITDDYAASLLKGYLKLS